MVACFLANEPKNPNEQYDSSEGIHHGSVEEDRSKFWKLIPGVAPEYRGMRIPSLFLLWE